MRNLAVFFATTFVAASLFSGQSAHSQNLIELGKLECFVDEGTGQIIGSSRDLSCVFTSNKADWGEDNYFGVFNRLGIDIGKTDEAQITWLVVAASLDDYQPGFLAGNYVGAAGSASFAVGLGANALIGGSNKSIALQPFSISTQTGFNLAAGIAEIELRSIE